MATKITQLTENTTPTSDDLIELVNDPAGTPLSQKSKLSSIFAAMQTWIFGSDAGASDTYVVTLAPVPAAYVTGQHYRFKANTANTGVCTVNFNGLGAKTIKKAAGGITTDLADNDIRAGQWVDLVYDGTNMQMQSLLGNAPVSGGSGDVVGPGSATDNALVRFDSTTGKLIQNSTVTLDDTGAITVPEMSAPSTPASGKVAVYAKADGLLYSKDDAGAETLVSGGAGGGSITPLVVENANTVAQRNSTNIQTFNVYSTYTDASNYERLRIAYNNTQSAIEITSEKGGTGTVRELRFSAGGTNYLYVGSVGFGPVSDNVFDLGSDGVREWKSITGKTIKGTNSVGVGSGSSGSTKIYDSGHGFGGVLQIGNVFGDNGSGTFGGPKMVNTPGTFTSDQNNLDLSNSAGYMQRWSTDASRNFTGLDLGQVSGQTHVIINVGSNDIVLKHQSASSTAANRFLCSTGADITLTANQAANINYDSTTARWRVFKRN